MSFFSSQSDLSVSLALKLGQTGSPNSNLKGQFTPKLKVHIFVPTCSAFINLDRFGMGGQVLEVLAEEMSSSSTI